MADGRDRKRRGRAGWAVLVILLCYVGVYAYSVEKWSAVTFSAGPDGAAGETQIVWERRLQLRKDAALLFSPLEFIDRKLRPGFWEWEERVPDSELEAWMRDKRMQ